MANDQNVVPNAVKLLGEAVLPGASLMVEGRVGSGLVHTALGVAAGALLGPLGVVGRIVPLLIAANSFKKSVTDRNLWEGINTDLTASDEGVQRARPAQSAKP
jgi:hypothetical protein